MSGMLSGIFAECWLNVTEVGLLQAGEQVLFLLRVYVRAMAGMNTCFC